MPHGQGLRLHLADDLLADLEELLLAVSSLLGVHSVALASVEKAHGGQVKLRQRQPKSHAPYPVSLLLRVLPAASDAFGAHRRGALGPEGVSPAGLGREHLRVDIFADGGRRHVKRLGGLGGLSAASVVVGQPQQAARGVRFVDHLSQFEALRRTRR